MVERDAADAVAVAVDATAASAVMTSGEQGEDDVADGGGATGGGRVGL